MNRPLPYPIPGPAGNPPASYSPSARPGFMPGSGSGGMHNRIPNMPSSGTSPDGRAFGVSTGSKHSSFQNSSDSTFDSSSSSHRPPHEQPSLNKLINNLDASQMHLFSSGPWARMYESLPEKQIKSSLAIVRRLALLQAGARLSMLPVLVTDMKWVGRDAAVTLCDPTASLQATIHAGVFNHFAASTPITQHCVVLLKDVSAIVYDGEAKGFRVDVMQSIHLNVRLNNVERVIVPVKGHIQPTLPIHPTEMYTPFARAPPAPNIKRVLRARTPNQMNLNNNNNNNNNNQTITSPVPQRRPANNIQQIQQQQQQRPIIPRKRPPPNPYRHGQGQGNQPQQGFQQPYPKRPALHNDQGAFSTRFNSSPGSGQGQELGPTPASAFRPPSRTTPVPPTNRNPNSKVTLADTAAAHVTSSNAEFDEHLDSIMGGIDMDSVIDAHRKSQAVPSPSPSHREGQVRGTETQVRSGNMQTGGGLGVVRQMPSGGTSSANSELRSGRSQSFGNVNKNNSVNRTNSGSNNNANNNINNNSNGNDNSIVPKAPTSEDVKSLLEGLGPEDFE